MRVLLRPSASRLWRSSCYVPARHAATTPFYRPLPEPSVAWRTDDVEEARRVAQAKHMKFQEDEAAELPLLQQRLVELRKERASLEKEQKDVGKAIPALAKAAPSSPDLAAKRERARTLRTALRDLDKTVSDLTARSLAIRSAWPNRVHPDVPVGPESVSQVLRVVDARDATWYPTRVPTLSLPCSIADFEQTATWKEALQANPAHDHLAVAQARRDGAIDMTTGIHTTGPSWPYLMGTMSMMEHAISQYALSKAIQHGFVPVSVPDVIKTDVAERCGFRPRDEVAAQTYFVDTRRMDDTDEASSLCLAGTAEIPLASLVAKQTYSVQETTANEGGFIATHSLPVKLTALGHAFRAEAGARGADTRGLYRIHQFSKVEMFAVTQADASDVMLEALRCVQEDMVQGLGLAYRVLDMSSEELGASAYRKYDIEAWMPGRGSWGEICSASNCTDYQARRLAIKYKKDGQNHYAHTLNATAAAIPRLIVALLETYPSKDHLLLPASLRPFWLGGPTDARVRWLEPNVARHTAATSSHVARRPSQSQASFHTSAQRSSGSLERAKQRIRALAARTGSDPAPLLVAFLALHELTAIVPLFVIAAILALLGGGDVLLEAIDHMVNKFAPKEDAVLHEWIARGRRMATRMCARCDAVLHGEEGAPAAAVWLTSLTAAYVAVKLLLPVRIALSLAWAPATARMFIMPLWRRWTPRRPPST
ncbi:seryl-trna synthetase [Malassezia pachydermatis]|uniref:serine--tRNA ligase n=1 Tax=Malassezia pachydermatis TaxID=77020 RepID=A0A0M8MZA9_9BASI|nr:seryl-trna synthetase [Malassezia pachydermatis]KOS16541.1 seryl-trna synthetase [Malassezia pachydermatis]